MSWIWDGISCCLSGLVRKSIHHQIPVYKIKIIVFFCGFACTGFWEKKKGMVNGGPNFKIMSSFSDQLVRSSCKNHWDLEKLLHNRIFLCYSNKDQINAPKKKMARGKKSVWCLGNPFEGDQSGVRWVEGDDAGEVVAKARGSAIRGAWRAYGHDWTEAEEEPWIRSSVFQFIFEGAESLFTMLK